MRASRPGGHGERECRAHVSVLARACKHMGEPMSLQVRMCEKAGLLVCSYVNVHYQTPSMTDVDTVCVRV